MSERHCSSPLQQSPLRLFKTSSRATFIDPLKSVPPPVPLVTCLSLLALRNLHTFLLHLFTSAGFFRKRQRQCRELASAIGRSSERGPTPTPYDRSQAFFPSTHTPIFVFPGLVSVFLNDCMQIGTIDPARRGAARATARSDVSFTSRRCRGCSLNDVRSDSRRCDDATSRSTRYMYHSC
jgi:hypothetical protein